MKKLSRLLLPPAALAAAMLPVAGLSHVSAEEQVAIYLDVDTSDGPCVDIDSERTVEVGETFEVAVCVKDLSSEIGVFEIDVFYDLDVISVPEVPDQGLATDDNPDANAGDTTWGDPLGDDFDCSYGGVAYPKGNRPSTGRANRVGVAFITCTTIDGPWWLGDDETEGVLAVITMQGKGKGTSELAFTNTVLGDAWAEELGTCDPEVRYPMPCNGATIHVTKEGSGLGWPALLGIGLGVAAVVIGAVSVPLYLRRRR
ncbi:MAG: hypothetical protein QME71_07695 [Dehalococcoidia bacterium]|nr:hypothetical protein [Dehalococcoidia bacterium]